MIDLFDDWDAIPMDGMVRELRKNKFFELLDVDAVKEMIAKCAEDEVCIILPHYSINVQMWYNEQDCDPEQCDWDWDDFEEAIDYPMQVNDFDDLIVDVHGIMN